MAFLVSWLEKHTFKPALSCSVGALRNLATHSAKMTEEGSLAQAFPSVHKLLLAPASPNFVPASGTQSNFFRVVISSREPSHRPEWRVEIQ